MQDCYPTHIPTNAEAAQTHRPLSNTCTFFARFSELKLKLVSENSIFHWCRGQTEKLPLHVPSVDPEDMVLTSNQTSRLTYLRIWGSGNLPPAFFPLGRLKLQIFTHRPEVLWNAGGSSTTTAYSLTRLAKSLYRRKFTCLNLYNCVSSRVISVIATSLDGVKVKWVHIKLWAGIFLLTLILNVAVQEKSRWTLASANAQAPSQVNTVHLP